jgi:hypothetical protein
MLGTIETTRSQHASFNGWNMPAVGQSEDMSLVFGDNTNLDVTLCNNVYFFPKGGLKCLLTWSIRMKKISISD